MNALTCADVEARDLEARYLAGTLTAAEATEYEAHYFGCDTCWPSLQRATEIRAAFARSEKLPARAPSQGPPQVSASRPARRAPAWGIAAAAVLVIAVGAGVYLRDGSGDPGSRTAQRGVNGALTVVAMTEARASSISWGAIAEADRYVVRLYRSDGDLVLERETDDTTFALSADSIAPRTSADTLYWQVLALDRLRQSLARSPLTASPPPVPPIP